MSRISYSLEDPPEYIINSMPQVRVGEGPTNGVPLVDPASGWRMDGLMANLGPVVAYERTDGGMALSTWDGKSISVWAKFDVAQLPPLLYMRDHMIEAVSIDEPRPVGFTKVICFVR